MNLTNPTPLASACFARLAEEEAVLGEALTALQNFRVALAKNDSAGLEAVASYQVRAGQRIEQARQHRAQFRQLAGSRIGLPAEQVTLGRLLPFLAEPERGLVQAGRLRLHNLARQLQRHSRLVAALSEDFLAVVQRVFQDLAGGTAGVRYGPAGTFPALASGSVFQAQG